MNTGVLAFSLNGEYMGVAFKDPKLTKGPIYPAVALLHCAGCKIKSSKTVPSYFKD
jgi:E3 ubiquitin-protein ligase NRDP1